MGMSKSRGDMYPWVTNTHTHIGGQCPHLCGYCFVQAISNRFRRAKYSGPLRLIEEEFSVNYGHDRIIFIEHMNDMWATDVPDSWIERILEHCCKFPDNTYVFQTKNPARYFRFLAFMPKASILGTTIETNVLPVSMSGQHLSYAPPPWQRAAAMMALAGMTPFQRFVTVEPILDFDVDTLVKWLAQIQPSFINIGADSKGHNLPEPSADKVKDLINALTALGLEIRQKTNLTRLLAPSNKST